MSLQNDLRHLPITRFKTCFWQVIHNIVMDLEISISETSVELINGLFGWGAKTFSKTWVHLYWMKTKTHLNDNLHQVSPLRRKQRQTHKCSEDKAGLEFTRTLVCSDWWWFIGEGLPEQESVTSSGYIIAPCTMHYLVPGQKDKQTDINRQKDRQTDIDIQTD